MTYGNVIRNREEIGRVRSWADENSVNFQLDQEDQLFALGVSETLQWLVGDTDTPPDQED